VTAALVTALLAAAGNGGAPGGAPASGCAAAEVSWPTWTRYVEAFLSGDGRVIDHTDHHRTTSEGQAYALFFALVANDRPLFDRVLRWTDANLAQGRLAERLPAWAWGQRRDGSWGILDANSASDADLWIAYALVEAGRLWSEPRYGELGRRVLSNVAAREVATLPGLGPTLLPGPRGFVVQNGRGWRLNPSYVPPQVLRAAADAQPGGPWSAVLATTLRMLRETARRGAFPDWVLYTAGRGFGRDPVKGAVGSYDAIRVYLWLGMLPPGEPAQRELQDGAKGALLRVLAERGTLPERIDVASLKTQGQAPVGFYAALLPLAAAVDPEVVPRLAERLSAAAKDGLYGSPPAYYDQNLVLFARGFVEGRFRFAASGGLEPAWGGACAASAR
jgi:endo-1,4-beta-D-glucanase Y